MNEDQTSIKGGSSAKGYLQKNNVGIGRRCPDSAPGRGSGQRRFITQVDERGSDAPPQLRQAKRNGGVIRTGEDFVFKELAKQILSML